MHACCLFAFVAAFAAGSDPTASPDFQHPLIAQYGGAVELPDAAEQPRKGSKLLLDLTSDELKGDVLKGLDRAAMLVNLYSRAGVKPGDGMELAVVIHGPATRAVLQDEPYARGTDDPSVKANPNLPLLRQLRSAGVEIYVCGQALARQRFATSDVAPEATVAVSAAIVHVNRQLDGYVLVP